MTGNGRASRAWKGEELRTRPDTEGRGPVRLPCPGSFFCFPPPLPFQAFHPSSVCHASNEPC